MGDVLFILGAVLAGAGGIWLIFTAFKESMVWGFGVWLVPLVGLIFVAVHWDDAKRPFLLSLAGTGVMILGAVLSGSNPHS